MENYVNVMPTRVEEFARYEAALWQLQEKYSIELEVALYLPEERMPVTMLYKRKGLCTGRNYCDGSRSRNKKKKPIN